MRKLQENYAHNKEKIKSINKLHKRTIKLLKTSNTTKIERGKGNSATLPNLLSSALKEERNCKTTCLELREKKIEENKKQMECDIMKLKCDHNTEIVLLKNELKVHEEKQDRMEWIFGQQMENPFLKNVNSDKDNTIIFLDQVSKQLAVISLEDLCKYFLQTQSIIQQSEILRMEAEQDKEDLQQICSEQKQQMIDMKHI